MRFIKLLVPLLVATLAPTAFVSPVAAANLFKLTVKTGDSGITDVDLVDKKGKLYPGTTLSSGVRFSIPFSKLNGASLIAYKNGQLVGPVGKKLNSKLQFRLRAKPVSVANEPLTKAQITLSPRTADEPYAPAKVKGKVFSASSAVSISSISPLGINLVVPGATAKDSLIKSAVLSGAAKDSDGDALLDLFDTDADGDGIIDIADANIDVPSSQEIDTGVALPFTTLFLSKPNTINWHINGSLNQEDIEEVIGGENQFAIAYFFNFAPDDTAGASIESGEVICPDALEYCRPVSAGVSTATYSGFSEGDPSLVGQLWSDLDFGLEEIVLGGGGGGTTWAAAIQPRVGTDKFRPGDTYRVDFRNEAGFVVARKALTLPPYFVTVPAVRAYSTISSDEGDQTLMDYTNSNSPGSNSGNPIVISNAGPYAGKLRLNIWRLQRAAVPGLESGDYIDFGHLNYGVIINNMSGEFTCGELYSDLSSTLTELPSQGNGGGYQSNTGALLWPLVDSADDYASSAATDSTTIGNNTISFTVDLEACLARNGLSSGVHTIYITAAGADTGNGSNRGVQSIHVQINP